MAKRSFTTKAEAPPPADTPKREADFDLGGVGQLTGDEWREEFWLLPLAPVGAVDDLMASITLTDDGRLSYRQTSLLRFFRGVLVEEDVPRFEALMRDKDRAVDLSTLGEIMMELGEDMLGVRPTRPPSPSTGGRRNTNGSSGDDSSVTATKAKPKPTKRTNGSRSAG